MVALKAESRAEALGEAVEELGHLEAYIEAVQPPMKEAEALSVSHRRVTTTFANCSVARKCAWQVSSK